MNAYAHRYRIERDYFEAMCEVRGWLVQVIHGIWYVCQIPPGVRSAVKMQRGYWSVQHTCIGTYTPRTSCTFQTNLVPKPDPRVIPWCNCCAAQKPEDNPK